MIRMATNKNTDDFFSLLEDEQKVRDPFAKDEILFRDENGNFKVLKDGQVSDLAEESNQDKPSKKNADSGQSVSPPAEASGLKKKNLPKQAVKPVIENLTAPAIAKPLDIEKEVSRVVDKSGIHFSDNQTASRFKNIVISRLRDVRDQIQTREMLLKSFAGGGMGFNSEEADRVLAIINQEFDQLDGKLRDEMSKEPFSELKKEAKQLLAESSEPPTLIFEPAKPVKEKLKTPAEKIRNQKKPLDSVPSISFGTGQGGRDRPVKAKPLIAKKLSTKEISQLPKQPLKALIKKRIKKEEIKPVIAELEEARVERISKPLIAETSNGKTKIEDIKFKPKLTGPIEEIKTMALADFRRLGSDPEKITEKIKEKINLLEEESFAKRLAGIKAWKESNVYRLYLELGDQSMEEKQPVAEVMSARQKNNQPTLTEQEFEAIVELNRELRY